jgi:hypothetical protein
VWALWSVEYRRLTDRLDLARRVVCELGLQARLPPWVPARTLIRTLPTPGAGLVTAVVSIPGSPPSWNLSREEQGLKPFTAETVRGLPAH